MKFTFKVEHDTEHYYPAPETVKLSVTADYLPDVIEAFERFLRGAGFVFDRVTVESNATTKEVNK